MNFISFQTQLYLQHTCLFVKESLFVPCNESVCLSSSVFPDLSFPSASQDWLTVGKTSPYHHLPKIIANSFFAKRWFGGGFLYAKSDLGHCVRKVMICELSLAGGLNPPDQLNESAATKWQQDLETTGSSQSDADGSLHSDTFKWTDELVCISFHSADTKPNVKPDTVHRTANS